MGGVIFVEWHSSSLKSGDNNVWVTSVCAINNDPIDTGGVIAPIQGKFAVVNINIRVNNRASCVERIIQWEHRYGDNWHIKGVKP